METKSEHLKEKMYSWLLSEICLAESAGVPVQVDGKLYSVQNAEDLKGVMENHYYMKSYTCDEQGNIVQIDFDHIKEV